MLIRKQCFVINVFGRSHSNLLKSVTFFGNWLTIFTTDFKLLLTVHCDTSATATVFSLNEVFSLNKKMNERADKDTSDDVNRTLSEIGRADTDTC